MDADRIQYLANFIPNDSDYFRYSLSSFGTRQESARQNQVDRFLVAYRDLAFGYHFVRALLKDGLSLPPDVHERALIDLYWFEQTGQTVPGMIEALSLNHPSTKFMANSLQALLLTEASDQEIAQITGLPTEQIKLYEELFFNVRSRRKESMFIASVVYPEHRLVETMEGYIKEVDAGSFLKRSAYNNGVEDAAYFIGLKVESIQESAFSNAQEMANRLESSIMANGYFLARNGYLNQRSTHGINAAKSLIVAAKQGGEGNEERDSFGPTSLGAALLDDLGASKGKEMKDRIAEQTRLVDEQLTLASSQAYDIDIPKE